jgi:sterol desaturase/sphingolipid hydroxylase (fatty acid hydroxylase superfamily)
MAFDNVLLVFYKLLATCYAQTLMFLGFAALFTFVGLFRSQQSTPGKAWWGNPGLFTDISYALINAVASSYFRIPAFLLVVFVLSGTMSKHEISDYFANGRGPLSTLPFWCQAIVYVVLGDFLLYWIHRGFHRSRMWPFHAIHHSATEVDWTTAYRFHPINLMLQPAFVAVVMITLGIRPEVMAFVMPIDSVIGFWQHSNSNWTLGPLRYVIASPVFHRWHHTMPDEGGNSNFAPTLSVWDWLFGTFYMPEGRLPEAFGVEDAELTEGYFKQLLYPFRRLGAAAPDPVAISSAPAISSEAAP